MVVTTDHQRQKCGQRHSLPLVRNILTVWSMITSRLTSKAQTTIPQPVRTALRLREGDEIAYAIEAGRVVLTPVQLDETVDDSFRTFSEWDSPADAEAYGSLRGVGPGEGPVLLCQPPGAAASSGPGVAVPEVPGAPNLLWVLMVISAGSRGWPGDVAVSDLDKAAFPAPSVVRPAKIAMMEAGDGERIGIPAACGPASGPQKSYGTASGRCLPCEAGCHGSLAR